MITYHSVYVYVCYTLDCSSNIFQRLALVSNLDVANTNEIISTGFSITDPDTAKCLTCGFTKSLRPFNRKKMIQCHISQSPNCENAKYVAQLSSTHSLLDLSSKNNEILYNRKDARYMYPKYKTKEQRFNSFIGWNYGNIQLPSSLVEAGFYSNGQEDQVICFSCGLWLAKWEPDEKPWNVHAKHCPGCIYLNEVKPKCFIDKIQEDWRKIYKPEFPDFEDQAKRISLLKTFPSGFFGMQTPEMLGRAGFFPKNCTKAGTLLVCHYCGRRIMPWTSHDDAWEMHIRSSRDCKYIETRKGQKYIDDVYTNYETERQKRQKRLKELEEDRFTTNRT